MLSKIFDLNIEKILDSWEVHHAIREIIANALDEQMITNTKAIKIYKDENQLWHIRDYGRGIKYDHLTQNENNEKISNPNLIGKFGIGLKDALATFERKNVKVLILSRYGDITIHKHSKHGFNDIITLHAEINEPKHPDMIGTDFIIEGVSNADIDRAKELFLQFTADEIVDDTRYGQILKGKVSAASIYLNGMKVAEEDNFLFSYNITSLDSKIKNALNRERTNVGRTAYSDRVKLILKSSVNENVALLLCNDLEALSKGDMHDELKWIDVQEHAVKILNSSKKVVFVSSDEIIDHPDAIDNARNDGIRIVAIPENLVNKVRGQEDLSGKPIVELTNYIKTHNESFQFKYVDYTSLTANEKRIFDLKDQIVRLVGGLPNCVKEVRISETMREDFYQNTTLGCWDESSSTIVIKRSQLASNERFSGTLLHEVAHAKSKYGDVSRLFEEELTNYIGKIASKYIDERQVSKPNQSLSNELYKNWIESSDKNMLEINSATMLQTVLKSATAGSIEAQRAVGNMYNEGIGTVQDHIEAIKWYIKSASQGDVKSMHNLGVMYFRGRGTAQDYRQAFHFFELAANRGSVVDQFNVGIMYEAGVGTAQDYEKAAQWYKEAAKQNHSEAHAALTKLNAKRNQ